MSTPTPWMGEIIRPEREWRRGMQDRAVDAPEKASRSHPRGKTASRQATSEPPFPLSCLGSAAVSAVTSPAISATATLIAMITGLECAIWGLSYFLWLYRNRCYFCCRRECATETISNSTLVRTLRLLLHQRSDVWKRKTEFSWKNEFLPKLFARQRTI